MLFPFWASQDLLLGAVGLDDGFGMDDLIVFCAGATTVLTFFLLVGRLKLWGSIKRTWRWLQKFQDDWDGTAGDAGHAPILGMMEWRRTIDAELKTNGGGSMKDALVKAVAAAEDNGKRLDGLTEEVAAVRGEVAHAGSQMAGAKTQIEEIQRTVESMVNPDAGGDDNRINTDAGGK